MKVPATILVCVVALTGVLAQTTPSPDVLLKAALQREQVDGDLTAALRDYQALVDAFPSHESAARARVQMARIHERQGNRTLARAQYQQVIRTHPDSPAARAATSSGLPPATRSPSRPMACISTIRAGPTWFGAG